MSNGDFAAWLRKQLRERDWSAADLSMKMERRPSVISRWVRGERIPDPVSCELIAEALRIDRDQVLAAARHRIAAAPTPDDELRVRMHGLIDHTDWAALDPQTVAIAIGTLESYQRAASRASKPRGAS